MPHIGKVKLGVSPVICAVLQEHASPRIVGKVRESRIQLVELRIDKLNALKIDSILITLKTLKRAGFSVIGTIRIAKEGGAFSGPENKRLEIFRKIIRFVDAVDVELQSQICKSVVQLAKKNKKSAIVSFHDFKKTPSAKTLLSILKKSRKAGAGIVKIAAMARTHGDFSRAMDFLASNRSQNLIVISMGKIGAVSRFAFPFLGSLVSYGFVGKKSAPGQLPVAELAKALTPYPG